jgi:hypothetical protein
MRFGEQWKLEGEKGLEALHDDIPDVLYVIFIVA